MIPERPRFCFLSVVLAMRGRAGRLAAGEERSPSAATACEISGMLIPETARSSIVCESQVRGESMRNLLLAGAAVACALIGPLASTNTQARVVTLYCIVTTYERGEPVQRIMADMKIDYDSQTVNDRPVAMANKRAVVAWKYADTDAEVSSSISKITWKYSSTDIRLDGTVFHHRGNCKIISR
jgi:hypothetical protein